MQSYRSGILSYNCTQQYSNHVVAVVGISNNVLKVRNSWGGSWGEKGYFRWQRSTTNNYDCLLTQTIYQPQKLLPWV